MRNFYRAALASIMLLAAESVEIDLDSLPPDSKAFQRQTQMQTPASDSGGDDDGRSDIDQRDAGDPSSSDSVADNSNDESMNQYNNNNSGLTNSTFSSSDPLVSEDEETPSSDLLSPLNVTVSGSPFLVPVQVTGGKKESVKRQTDSVKSRSPSKENLFINFPGLSPLMAPAVKRAEASGVIAPALSSGNSDIPSIKFDPSMFYSLIIDAGKKNHAENACIFARFSWKPYQYLQLEH
jgi:hypothetical protein